MAKKGLTKNQKIGLVVGGVVLVGGIIALVLWNKKNKKIKECTSKGGTWDKEKKQCISATGTVIEVETKNEGDNVTLTGSTDLFGSGTKNQTGGGATSTGGGTTSTGGGGRTGSPFSSLPNNASTCERYVQRHDSVWDYVKCGGTWFTKRKSSSGGWISLAGNSTAIGKLEAYSGS